MPVRVAFALNAGPRAGKPAGAPSLVAPDGAAICTEAIKKLRLKKKDAAAAQLYLWTRDVRAGTPLPRDGSVDVRNDDVVVVSLGEPYQGPRPSPSSSAEDSGAAVAAAASTETAAAAAAARPAQWLRWEARPHAGSLAVVEWSDARTMNATLGRMSTLLEHPTLCAAETDRVVDHETQRSLPSSRYLGHNLYARTLLDFERLAVTGCGGRGSTDTSDDAAAATAASDTECAFLRLWRSRDAPQVVISFVVGEASTLAHELCHARFALDDAYRRDVSDEWSDRAATLGRWLSDLGYHSSRHADEFGAYVLTEPPAFWRGRVPPADVKALRARLVDAATGSGGEWVQGEDFSGTETDAEARARDRQRHQRSWWLDLEVGAAVACEDLTGWFPPAKGS
jgi:hypothetical protein